MSIVNPLNVVGNLGSNNVVPVVASVSLTGQVAAIAATNLLATAPVGLYRVHAYGVVTTAFVTSGLTITIGWNDGTAAQTATLGDTGAATATVSGITVGSFIKMTVFLRGAAATNITYTTSSAGTIGAYSLFITLERIA